MTVLIASDPRTGEQVGSGVQETTLTELDSAIVAADQARSRCAGADSPVKIEWLISISAALDAARDELISLADAESGLGRPRLNAELDRALVQLGLFVDVLADGSYLEVIIDESDPAARPAPRPLLRRGMRAVGPVGVWAASNFPFAFGVIGGDAVSALAAGCPVIVKAHPSQPSLSARLGEVVTEALSRAGAPDGAFAVVHGMPAASMLIKDPRIRAASFTGSVSGGRALFDVACSRPEPIPFFGELGSINPVFVTPSAASVRGQEISEGLVASVMLGVGQFCTKPGIAFVPARSGIVKTVTDLVRAAPAGAMLNASMQAAYRAGASALANMRGVGVVASAGEAASSGAWVRPQVAITTMRDFLTQPSLLTEECFGPLTVLVAYEDAEDLMVAARLIPGCLTATIHGQDNDQDDRGLCRALIDILVDTAGRLIWNGWPTGVAVAWAMHHGGPYPASTSAATTSVGAPAIGRFLRPVSYQSFPDDLIPLHLRDDALTGVVRRNGVPTIHESGSRDDT